MESKVTSILFVCLLSIGSLVAGQTTQAPHELQLNDQSGNQTPENNNNQSPVQPRPAENELAPTDNRSPGDDSGEPADNQQMDNPFMPNFLRPRPTGEFGHPLFNLLNGGIFDHIRQQQQMMDKQFSRLEQQAAEGQEVRYFSRNGVSYVRTCTTKRVN